MYTSFSTTVGDYYNLTLIQDHHATITVGYKVGNSANSSGVASGTWVSGAGVTVRKNITFKATATTTFLTLFITSGTNTYGVYWDSVSCRRGVQDRSVNGNGLQVFGTIDKDPVATGAELVGYSGFSSSNYLEQPYTGDLDFGTGDFSYSLWVKPTGSVNTNAGNILTAIDEGNSSNFLWIELYQTNTILMYSNGLGSYYSSNTYARDVWSKLDFVVSSGNLLLYMNGKLDSTHTAGTTLPNPLAGIHIGSRENGSSPINGSISLVRISGTAPSAEQIKEIYEAEKPLFQENAKCTLNGSSSHIYAVDYDDSTELVHVGTSGGRSVFQGLRRVEGYSTSGVTELAAQGGIVVEEY
jgi:hypothetical protein